MRRGTRQSGSEEFTSKGSSRGLLLGEEEEDPV